MIITKSTPFPEEEIGQLKEQFGIYIEPQGNNTKNEIQDAQVRAIFEEHMKFFFQEVS